MSEKSSNGSNEATDKEIDEDPLAELARIVSAGSVFCDISDAQAKPAQEPVVQPESPFQEKELSDIFLESDDTAAAAVDGASFVDEMALVDEAQRPSFMKSMPEEVVESHSSSDEVDLSDELELTLGNQLEEELLNELQNEPAVPQPEEVPAADVNLDTVVDELDSSPAQSVEVNSTEPDAIEEALNLDSFFDAEFAAANNSAPPVAPIQADGSAGQLGGQGVLPEGIVPAGDIDPLDSINLDAVVRPKTEHFPFGVENHTEAGGSKTMLALAAVLLVAIAGGSIVYFLSGADREGDSDLVVTASDEPVRVKPTDPGGKAIPDQDRTVYDAISGEANPEDGTGALVDRSEELIVGVDAKPDDATPAENLNGSTTVREISSTTPPAGPRTVRTVTIRPDGSIVRDEADAPEVNLSTGDDVTPQTATPQTTTPEPSTETSAPQETAAAQEEAAALQEEAVEQAAPSPEETSIVAPEQEVASLPTDVAVPVSRPNNPRPSAAQRSPARSVPQPSSSGSFVVQLSSQRTEAQATSSFRNMQRRFSILSSYSPIIQRADLGAKGVFYRLQVGRFSTRSEAISFCENLKGAGGDCIVSRG